MTARLYTDIGSEEFKQPIGVPGVSCLLQRLKRLPRRVCLNVFGLETEFCEGPESLEQAGVMARLGPEDGAT